jgi:hypothetical protein
LSRRYEIDVTPDLVEKDDDGWYPQLRMHYIMLEWRLSGLNTVYNQLKNYSVR